MKDISRTQWIVSPLWDALLILNFIWLIPITQAVIQNTMESFALLIIAFLLAPFIRDTHTFSPIIGVLYSPSLREKFWSNLIARGTITFIFVGPLLVIPASWMIPWHVVFGEVGSYLNPISILGVTYGFLTFWHISMQNYGVLALYDQLNTKGRTRSPQAKLSRSRADLFYCHSIYIILNILAFFAPRSFFSAWVASAPPILRGLASGDLFLIAGIVLSTLAIGLDYIKGRSSLPRSLFFICSSIIPYFAYRDFILTYALVVLLNHCTVELALSTQVVARSTLNKRRHIAFLMYTLLVLALGSLVYHSNFRHYFITQMASFRVYRLYGGELSLHNFANGLLAGTLYTIGLMHFYADRLLFRKN